MWVFFYSYQHVDLCIFENMTQWSMIMEYDTDKIDSVIILEKVLGHLSFYWSHITTTSTATNSASFLIVKGNKPSNFIWCMEHHGVSLHGWAALSKPSLTKFNAKYQMQLLPIQSGAVWMCSLKWQIIFLF